MSIQFQGGNIFDMQIWPFLLWGMLWLYVLYGLLTRKDLDTQTQILWTIVLIFVPLFGVFMYWLAAPSGREVARRQGPLTSDVSGTPWERDPNHVEDR